MKSKGIRFVIRSRSLTVTALSNGDYCIISPPMKFQLKDPRCSMTCFSVRSESNVSGVSSAKGLLLRKR